jgi:DNA repair exonuclease SbcCD ATPase subunit
MRLVNFKGIYLGTGLYDLEIDFTKTDKRTVILIGKNGSGKSTIMSMSHPYMEDMDERGTELILEGKDGIKEIDYLRDDGTTFHIQHYYGKKNKSFMFKNSMENNLNGNGGKRTFEDLCTTELGVTPEHFKLIKIGSASSNFIDMNSTARKNFMGKFTPSIEEYLPHFKTVNDKFNATGKEIKYLTDEINKLEDESEVLNSIEVLGRTLNHNQTLANQIAAEQMTVKNENESIEETLADFAQDLENRESLIASNAVSADKLEQIYTDFPSRRSLSMEEVAEKRDTVEAKLVDLRKKLADLMLRKEKIQADKHNAVSNRNAAQADESKYSRSPVSSVSSLKTMLATEKDTLAASKAKYDSITEFASTLVESLDIDEATDSVNELHRLATRIHEAKLDLQSSEDNDFIQLYLLGKSSDELDQAIVEATEAERANKANRTALTRQLRKLQDDLVASRAIREVVGMCKTATCGVYKIGLSELAKDGEVKKAEKAIEDLGEEIISNETTLDLLGTIRKHHALFNSQIFMAMEMHAVAATKEEFAALLELQDASEIGSIIYNTSTEELTPMFDFGRLITKINLFRKMNDSKRSIENIETKLSNLGNAEELLADIRSKIATFKDQIESLKVSEAELIEQIEAVETEIDQKEQIVELYSNIHDLQTEIAGYSKQLKTLNKIYERNKGNIEKLETNKQALKSINVRKLDADELVEETTDALNKQKLKLARIKEFKERKESLTSTRQVLALIKETLDIKTGMPLYVLGAYLDEIKEATNELLSMVFGEGFYIDFVITDSDFLIPIYQNGTLYAKDILMCSQGEVALAKCSLSLGIISQAIRRAEKKYNIVCLDEIDSELDDMNRQRFLEVLERQLDKLACQQCLVISHNDAFYTAELGLIMLKGAKADTNDEDFMMNKDIVLDLR